MKTTLPAICIAAIVMITAIATLFLKGIQIPMIMAIGIASGFLTQKVLFRIEKNAGIYHFISIVLNGVASVVIDSFIRDEKVLVFCACSFFTSLVSIFYLSFKKHEKETEGEYAKKRLAHAEATDYLEIAKQEVTMEKPYIEKAPMKKVERTMMFPVL